MPARRISTARVRGFRRFWRLRRRSVERSGSWLQTYLSFSSEVPPSPLQNNNELGSENALDPHTRVARARPDGTRRWRSPPAEARDATPRRPRRRRVRPPRPAPISRRWCVSSSSWSASPSAESACCRGRRRASASATSASGGRRASDWSVSSAASVDAARRARVASKRRGRETRGRMTARRARPSRPDAR